MLWKPYRGRKENCFKALATMVESELFLCTDTNELYVCLGAGKSQLIGKVPYQEFQLVDHRR
jgi:hypothetical protein